MKVVHKIFIFLDTEKMNDNYYKIIKGIIMVKN